MEVGGWKKIESVTVKGSLLLYGGIKYYQGGCLHVIWDEGWVWEEGVAGTLRVH